MSPKPIVGKDSWNKTASRSWTVREYKKRNLENRERPKFEALVKENHLSILTGANVLRKRQLTFKGMVLGFWGGFLTLAQTVVTFGFKTSRLKRNAELTAGQKFDAASTSSSRIWSRTRTS